jgi:GntR family transcriptional regulator
MYRQVAAQLRARIADGTLAPGQELRSEPDLAAEFGTGRDTIRDALNLLRGEGLIETRRGFRTRVRERVEPTIVRLKRGQQIAARMPTPEERLEHDLPDGVPVFVVDGLVYPADRYALKA